MFGKIADLREEGDRMKPLVYLVAGGDWRQVHLAKKLAQTNTVYALGFAENVIFSQRVTPIKGAIELPAPVDVAVLPIPACSGERAVNTPLSPYALSLDEVLNRVKPDGMVLGGLLTPAFYSLCKQRNLTAVDYMEREELAIENAVPTAEGAIQIAMEKLPTTLFGERCLITGFGRIGKVLTRDLLALGMKVTVAARKQSDLSQIRLYGANSMPIAEMADALPDFRLILNTVPAKLFDADKLAQIPKDSLLIDLASKPGGVDFDAARQLGVNVIWALSLPGKVAPITAGQIICDTIGHIIAEAMA